MTAPKRPMVRMSVEFLRGIVEPGGGAVWHGPPDSEGYVTELVVRTPLGGDERPRRRPSAQGRIPAPPRSEGSR